MTASGRIIPFTRTSTRKLDFRVIINLFNLILFALLPAGGVLDLGVSEQFLDLIAITSPAVSILWTTTATVLLLKSSLKRPYHPAIDLTFDAISGFCFWILGAFLIAQATVPEGLSMCSPYFGGSGPGYCDPGRPGALKWRLNVAASTFMLANGLIHIVFFGIACHEVKLWRREQWGLKRERFELERI